MTLIKLALMLYSFNVDQRAACHTLLNAFLKSAKKKKKKKKHGRGPVSAEGTSHTVFSS